MGQGTLDQGWLSVGQALQRITRPGGDARQKTDAAAEFVSAYLDADAADRGRPASSEPEVGKQPEESLKQATDELPATLPPAHSFEPEAPRLRRNDDGRVPLRPGTSDIDPPLRPESEEDGERPAGSFDETSLDRTRLELPSHEIETWPLAIRHGEVWVGVHAPAPATLPVAETRQAAREARFAVGGARVTMSEDLTPATSGGLQGTIPSGGSDPSAFPAAVLRPDAMRWITNDLDRHQMRGGSDTVEPPPGFATEPDIPEERHPGTPPEVAISRNRVSEMLKQDTRAIHLSGPELDDTLFQAKDATGNADAKVEPLGPMKPATTPSAAFSATDTMLPARTKLVQATGQKDAGDALIDRVSTSAVVEETQAIFIPGTADPGRTWSSMPVATPATALSRVAQEMAILISRQGNGGSEIVLSPSELGRVRLRLKDLDGGLFIQISAERPETIELIRRNIDALSSELRQQGFATVNFSFGSDGGADHDRSAESRSLTETGTERSQDYPPRPEMQASMTHVAGQLDLLL
ncbi:MAG: flagellar hook-length control protein FliK [Rubellimicrobium sp.]|nr:flagellar hook-length control protein FliK [Rubellimicrobium sp.]